jgi:hypothetical protein
MKVKGPVIPKTYTSHPAAATTPTHSINDQFMLADPYKPGTLQTTAQTAYDADVANATKLANMGTTPSAQIGADYAQRGQTANSIFQDLAQHLAGIQTAQVAQGNAGAASTRRAERSIGSAASRRARARKLYSARTPRRPATTAARCRRRHSRAARRQNQQRAERRHARAADERPEHPEDARVAAVRGGSRVEAGRCDADVRTSRWTPPTSRRSYSEYTETTKNQPSQAAAQGAYEARRAEGRSATRPKKYATRRGLQLGLEQSQTKLATTSTTQAGATARAKTAAAARVKAAGLSAAAKKAAADEAAATSTSNNKRTNQTRRDTTGATAAGGKPVKSYKVTVLLPASSSVDPNTGKLTQTPAKRVVKNIPANVWTR